MAICSSKEMLLDARKNGYAVCAFNAENMEMVMAIVDTAVKMKSPVIIQTTPSTLKYAGPEVFAGMVRAIAEKVPIPIALHLDHGSSFELASQCVDAGYTSVMIDGSKLPIQENIDLTRKVVRYCSRCGIPVEAELGTIGGKEDNVSCGNPLYTDPGDAQIFAQNTCVDSLAVAIGTAHGVYKGTPRLDLDRLAEIRQVVDAPLVLHGSSGVPERTVQACIARGICKVNYATDLRIAYTEGVRAYLNDHPEAFDPKKFGAAGMECVCQCVADRITICWSAGKA